MNYIFQQFCGLNLTCRNRPWRNAGTSMFLFCFFHNCSTGYSVKLSGLHEVGLKSIWLACKERAFNQNVLEAAVPQVCYPDVKSISLKFVASVFET